MSTTKESYTAEEWQTLQFAPLWAFTQVAGMDDNIDEKEFQAMAKEFGEAALYKEPLVREVFGSIATDVGNVLEAYRKDPRKVEGGLVDTAKVLDEKSDPDEANGFKGSVIGVGKKVAEASGGLLGRGKMSEEESKALVWIATQLRWSPPA